MKDYLLAIYRTIRNNFQRFLGLVISDEAFIKINYFLCIGKKLDLNNPITYNEKLQWLKLYNRREEYIPWVDKETAKEKAAKLIGEEHIIPTIAVYDSFDEIEFDKLPDQFVLKTTHDSGGVVVVSDKSKFNKKKARLRLNVSMKRNFFYAGREWPYKTIKPRIIVEQYMVDESGFELKDYKFFCFDGEPKALFIATDRTIPGEEVKFDFFDMDFNHLDIVNHHPNANHAIEKPENFDEMIVLAKKLSKGYPHVRVDLYHINGQIYFGELTFFHFGGVHKFEPEEWDYKFGEWLTLPEKVIN